jgi:hypothetical protein
MRLLDEAIPRWFLSLSLQEPRQRLPPQPSEIPFAHHPEGERVEIAQVVGRMLWFTRKKFEGSYLLFIATRRG